MADYVLFNPATTVLVQITIIVFNVCMLVMLGYLVRSVFREDKDIEN